ncbi:MAG TPA: hypothetical protein VKB19_13545 [Pedobacter sp.]|nr:hypothetical protein [Pedobacter sp.]
MNVIPLLQSSAFSKSALRNVLRLVVFAGVVAFFFTGCKKDRIVDVETDPDPTTPISLSDSIYFEVDGKAYSSNEISGRGMGNSGAKVRFLDAPAEGMKNWGSVQGRLYYSPVDSIYFSYEVNFSSPDRNYTLSFGQGLHVRDMNSVGTMWYPKDIRNMLDKGERAFATDYQSFNSDGVWFAFSYFGSTGMPEYSFEDSSDYPQNDARFEITKQEQVDENRYRIEGKFETNLYNAEQKSRATNGFVRITVYKGWWGMVNLF